MAYALVGTIGVASQGAASASVTPAWGTGESRTAGNLLICFVAVTGSSTQPTTPSGWSIAGNNLQFSASATIFYKIAAGADTAPTIAAITSGVIAAQLAEYSGNATTSPLDRNAIIGNNASPLTATGSLASTAVGELMLIVTSDFRSVARATIDTLTSNHATITQAGNNNGTSSVNHYSFGYGVTTSNSGVDTATMTASITTSVTGINVVEATFKLGATVTQKSLTATLTSTAALNKRINDGGFVANLSFSGNFAKSKLLLQNFAATLFGGSAISDGAPVGLWNDSSGNGNNATAAGSLRPTFKTNIKNGLPVVRFTSAGTSGLNLTSPFAANTSSTILVVMKAASSGSAISCLGSTTASASFGPLPNSDGNLYLGWITNIYNAGTNDGAFHVYTSVQPTSNPPGFYQDGTSPGAPAFVGGGTSGTYDAIGRASSSYSDGDIAELVVYGTVLSGTDQANVEKYLGTKYGITVAGGSAVDPSSVSGLVGWWKADSLAVTTPSTAFSVKPLKNFLATFSPTATISRRVNKVIVATLSFVGDFVKNFIHIGTVFTQSFTATLFQSGGTAPTDNFNRSNGALGANWATIPAHSALAIVSNTCQTSTLSTFCSQIWDTSTFNSDQYSQGVIGSASTSGSEAVGVIVRAKTGVDEFYLAFVTSTQIQIYVRSSGGYSLKATNATACVSSDVIKLEVIGNVISVYRNGSFVFSHTAAGADIISGGKPGILIYDTGHGLSVDNWEGGPITGGSVASLTKKTGKGLGATLTSTAAVAKRLGKGLTAILTFGGVLVKRSTRTLTATLSFIGVLLKGTLFFRVFTATRSFVGSLNKQVGKNFTAVFFPLFSGSGSPLLRQLNKGLTATLGFVGSFVQVFSGGAHLFLQNFTATLAPTALLTKKLFRGLTATLSFVGSLSRRVGKGLFATLSFVGSLNRKVFKSLIATLSFVGNLLRGSLFFKSFTATLFSGTGGTGFARFFTVNVGQVPSTQTDFPVEVNVTDALLKSVSNGGHVQRTDGFDIGFYSDSGHTTKFKWEIDQYDPTTGELIAHVKVPSLAAGTLIYLGYGDPAITTFQGDSVNVWTNSYLGVYHLGDGTTLNVNSATGSNNGTNHGATATAGQLNGGASFAAASSQYIDLGTTIHPFLLTISGWVNGTTFPSPYNTVVGRVEVTGQDFWALWVKSNGKLACYAQRSASFTASYDGTGSHTLSTGTRYYLTMVFNNAVTTGALTGYVNASLDGSVNVGTPFDLNNLNVAVNIAADPITSPRFWNGMLDEIRIASVARSADWITTEYNNQSAPGTFMTLSGEVGSGGWATLVTSLIHGGTLFLQSVAGTLTFVGAFSRRPNKNLAATLSFVGTLTRRLRRTFNATLSFVGTLTKRTGKLLVATLSFVGNLTTIAVHFFTRSLTATLTFSGNLRKQPRKTLSATLSFVGNLATQFIQGIQVFVQNFIATLVFSGTLTKRTKKFFTATLHFFVTFAANFVSTWSYYIDLRPGAFKPTETNFKNVTTTTTLSHEETTTTLRHSETETELEYSEAESGNFKNVKTNDNS